MLVNIEEVAKLNHITLYNTSRPGQYKAHCPMCGDRGRSFHLYISANKDVFCCQKCQTRGGVVAFHAWLKGIDFAAARDELYPVQEGKKRRPTHPAERLSAEQLARIGFLPRRLPRKAPHGNQKKWDAYRKATLSWIWCEWCAYEKLEREQSARLMHLLTKADDSQLVSTSI